VFVLASVLRMGVIRKGLEAAAHDADVADERDSAIEVGSARFLVTAAAGIPAAHPSYGAIGSRSMANIVSGFLITIAC